MDRCKANFWCRISRPPVEEVIALALIAAGVLLWWLFNAVEV